MAVEEGGGGSGAGGGGGVGGGRRVNSIKPVRSKHIKGSE